MMISDGMQGDAEFNSTATAIKMDDLEWLKDVRAVMYCLGTQEDPVK